ncbi:MAG: methyltransferase domain-containing protein [Thermodesulfobacteriota bacterium]
MNQKLGQLKKIEKLNVGCGHDIKRGYINLDIQKHKGVDVIHDLNQFPYPFPDNSFSYIYSRNCLDMLFNVDKVFDELYRICKKDAILDIIVYHFSSQMAYFFMNKTFFNVDSLNSVYIRKTFEVLEKRLVISERKTFLIWLLEKWINKHKQYYEKTCLKTLVPAYQLFFRLRVKK